MFPVWVDVSTTYLRAGVEMKSLFKLKDGRSGKLTSSSFVNNLCRLWKDLIKLFFRLDGPQIFDRLRFSDQRCYSVFPDLET